MNNNVNNRDNIIKLLRNTLELTESHTVDVLNAAVILKSNNIDCRVIQGWKVNIQKEYNREAYIYIELYINSKKYFLDILDDIYITRNMTKGVFKKKPSEKYIDSKLIS